MIFLTLAFSMHSYAQPVDATTAKQVGKSFLLAKTSILQQKQALSLRLVYTSPPMQKSADAHPSYYVFNIDSSGFIIVSGSRNTLPILAYSTESPFDPGNIPPNMAHMLSMMALDIQGAIEAEVPATEALTQQWDAYISGRISLQKATQSLVSPLLGGLSWNQSPYYNDSCPYDAEEDAPCVTGCVATAMAQIIKYWQYPTQGFGSFCYVADYASDGYGDYGLQCADFGNTTYRYNDMPDYLNASSSSTAVSAVAQLMYHCGVSVKMKYSPSGSGAYSVLDDYWIGQGEMDARTAFKEFWGYSKAEPAVKEDYSNESWVMLLKEQLNRRQPIYFSGRSPDNSSGHAFVCDGYDANDFFHFNWGWGGSYNCYCPVDSLVPGGIGTGGGHGNYSYSQVIIYNLRGENAETSLGWINSIEYINNLNNSSLATTLLLPDTCLQYYYLDGSTSSPGVHAMGSIFNPYSPTFGDMHTDPLIQKNSSYRLDSLVIRGGYFLGRESRYNPASPDTLRVYVSYLEPYHEVRLDTDYRYLHYTSFPYQKILCPKVEAPMSIPQKGVAIKPKAANTITIDYVLTAEDTSVLEWDESYEFFNNYYYTYVKIPLNYDKETVNGFEIPAGAVMSTIVTFIPGYDYQIGDTLQYVHSSEQYWVYAKNKFQLLYAYSPYTYDYFDNGNEYNNGSIVEFSQLRYQNSQGFLDSCYYPRSDMMPIFDYHITYNTRPTSYRLDIDTTVCESFSWNEEDYTEEEVLRFAYTDVNGMDSLIYIHLTIDRQPGEIDGIVGNNTLSHAGTYTYQIAPVEGGVFYEWSMTNPNWMLTILSDTSVSVDANGYGTGTLTVKVYTDKRVCESVAAVNLNYCQALGSMGEITGPAIIESSGTYNYSIAAVENAVTYQWTISNPAWMIVGTTTTPTIQLYIEEGGTATLKVKAYDNCNRFEERSYNILSKVGITESEIAPVRLSPNPTDKAFVIHIAEGKSYALQLVDVFGKVLLRQHINDQETPIDLSPFASGMYFVQITENGKFIGNYKVVKK